MTQPRTQAELSVMESTAQKFEQTNQHLQRRLDQLMQELAVLQKEWQGSGGRSFDQVKQAWHADQETINRALGATAEAIRTSGRSYATTDTTVADRFTSGGTGGGLKLPL